MASHVAQSFFVAQDARSIEDAARRMVARRIMSVIKCVVETRPHEAAGHLLADDRGRRGRRRGLLAGAEHGGGRDEGEDSDFHVCGC